MNIALPIASVLLVTAGLVVARPHLAAHSPGDVHGHLRHLLHGKEAPGMLEQHLEELAGRVDLTRDQRSRVAHILESSPVPARVHELVAAHGGQIQAVHGIPFDESAIRTASQRTARAQEELAVTVGRLLHEVHAILTPEQLVQIDEHHTHLLPELLQHVDAAEKSLEAWVRRNR